VIVGFSEEATHVAHMYIAQAVDRYAVRLCLGRRQLLPDEIRTAKAKVAWRKRQRGTEHDRNKIIRTVVSRFVGHTYIHFFYFQSFKRQIKYCDMFNNMEPDS